MRRTRYCDGLTLFRQTPFPGPVVCDVARLAVCVDVHLSVGEGLRHHLLQAGRVGMLRQAVVAEARCEGVAEAEDAQHGVRHGVYLSGVIPGLDLEEKSEGTRRPSFSSEGMFQLQPRCLQYCSVWDSDRWGSRWASARCGRPGDRRAGGKRAGRFVVYRGMGSLLCIRASAPETPNDKKSCDRSREMSKIKANAECSCEGDGPPGICCLGGFSGQAGCIWMPYRDNRRALIRASSAELATISSLLVGTVRTLADGGAWAKGKSDPAAASSTPPLHPILDRPSSAVNDFTPPKLLRRLRFAKTSPPLRY